MRHSSSLCGIHRFLLLISLLFLVFVISHDEKCMVNSLESNFHQGHSLRTQHISLSDSKDEGGNMNKIDCGQQASVSSSSSTIPPSNITSNTTISNCVFEPSSLSIASTSRLSIILPFSSPSSPPSIFISFINCTFQNNWAELSGAAVNITSTSPSSSNLVVISFEGCTFFNNSAIDDVGGAVSFISPTAKGSITFVDCHFSSNRAVYAGGAVCLSIPGMDVLFSNCDFNYTSTQSAQGVGGALALLQAGSTMIEECTFYANTAAGTLSSAGLSVGPLFQETIQAGLFIYSSLFQNNTNQLGAGAVIISSSHAKLIFQHCDFLENSGQTTGALQSTSEMEISFCTFDSNFILPNGSSITSSSPPLLSSLQTPNFAFQAGAISTATNLVVVGSTFIRNAGNNGGAISFGLDTAISDFKGSLDITDSLFYKNVARFGGGGAVKVNEVIGTISFSQCNFTQNEALEGGAVASVSSQDTTSLTTRKIFYDSCLFQGNKANNGGALYAVGTDNIHVNNSQFSYNVVDTDEIYYSETGGGGAIYARTKMAVGSYWSGILIITYSHFINNSAMMGQGGAILNAGEMSISESLFFGNHVEDSLKEDSIAIGGGVSNVDGNVTIVGCLFDSNIADDCGGAIALVGGNLTLKDSFVQSNIAPLGAGICIDGGNSPGLTSSEVFSYFTARDTEFSANNATLGGGIYISIGNSSISGCSFTGHYAALRGGAMYVAGFVYMVVTDSHFQGNLARDVGSALFLLDGEVLFSNTVFQHHKVDLATSLRSGSFPVYVTSGSLVCDDCTFSNNSFSFESDTESVTTGAICFAGGVGAIRRTNFTYNSGALVTTPPGPRFLEVAECNFEDNILGQAVIDASAGVISLANCSLGDVIPDYLTNSGDSVAPIYSFSAPVSLSLANSTLLRRKIQTTSPFFEVRGEAQVSIEDSTITDQHNNNDPTGVYSTANFTMEIEGINQQTFKFTKFFNSTIGITGAQGPEATISFFRCSFAGTMAGILYNHAPGKSQPTNVMITETLFSHSQLLLLALTAEIQAVSFETSQLLLRNTRAIVDGSLFWEGESSPQFSSILVGPLGNLTVLESGFCSGNVTLPRIDCLDTESEVMGDFNSSLVTGSCSQVLFPTPLAVLPAFSTSGFVCSTVSYRIDNTNFVKFDLDLIVEQMIIPLVENPVTLILFLTELDDSCGSLQENVQPIAQTYNATPGTVLSTSLAWNVSTVGLYLQQNSSYCFTVTSDGPIRFTLDLVYTPHSPWIQTSYIQATNRVVFSTQTMTFGYGIRDEWNASIAATNPLLLFDKVGNQIGTISGDNNYVSIPANVSYWYQPLSKQTIFMGSFDPTYPSASVYVISVWWIPMLVSFVALAALTFYSVRRFKQYQSNLQEHAEFIVEQQKEITQLIDLWKIDTSELNFIMCVAKGGFGEVWQGEWREHTVAIKKLRGELLELSPEHASEFEQEINFLRSIRHPNIVHFFGAGVSDGTPFLVTEFMSQGSLFSILKQAKPLSWNQKYKWSLDAAKGMKFLHGLDPPRIHRDIKPQNLLVSQGGVVKIGDFGTSKLIGPQASRRSRLSQSFGNLNSSLNFSLGNSTSSFPLLNANYNNTNNSVGTTGGGGAGGVSGSGEYSPNSSRNGSNSNLLSSSSSGRGGSGGATSRTTNLFDMTTDIGTILYMAPEVQVKHNLLGGPAYGTEADVYSFGITLWVIAKGDGSEPYPELNTMLGLENHVKAGGRPPVDETWPEGIQRLMMSCWNTNAQDRPTFIEITEVLTYLLESKNQPQLLDDFSA